MGGRVGHVRDADPGPARFGRRRLDRPDRDVVDGFGARRSQLGGSVGREANYGVRPEDRPGHGRWAVVLTYMDAIAPCGQGQVGAVIEDERHARVGTESLQGGGPSDQRPVVQRLLPELDDIDAAADARFDESEKVGAVGCTEVQAPSGQPVRRQVCVPPAAALALAFISCL